MNNKITNNNQLIKIMEYIKKEDLKDGDVFVAQLSHNHFMNKMGTGYSLHLKTDDTIRVKVLYKGGGFSYNNMRLATPEEKHWLNSCITADKFITFDEAMESFVPEYVECTLQRNGSSYKLETIYKTNLNGLIIGGMAFYQLNKKRFKPSTKEAYDAQFVVKEVKVIKPLPQFKIIESIETITKVENNEGNQFFIGDNVIGSKTKIKSKIISFKYNVDKTAILAITDKTLNIGIGINHLEHYIEPKVEFKIGDKIQLKYGNTSKGFYLIITKIENDIIFFKYQNGYQSNHCRVMIKNAIKVN